MRMFDSKKEIGIQKKKDKFQLSFYCLYGKIKYKTLKRREDLQSISEFKQVIDKYQPDN